MGFDMWVAVFYNDGRDRKAEADWDQEWMTDLRRFVLSGKAADCV